MNPPERPSMPPPVATSTAERIARIVEAAEKAASAVIDDAEAQARRYLEDAQAEADRVVSERLSSVSELSDSLVTQAEAIKQQSDRLLASLEGVGTPASASPPPPPPVQPTPPPPQAAPSPVESAPPPPAPTPHLSAVEPSPAGPWAQPQAAPPPPPASAPAPQPAATAQPQGGGSDAAARLLATQMAISGASREEIDKRLRTGFEIGDTAPILEAILGPEG